MLPRDVRSESLFANQWVFRIKPRKVKLLAGEQKATEQRDAKRKQLWGSDSYVKAHCLVFGSPPEWDLKRAWTMWQTTSLKTSLDKSTQVTSASLRQVAALQGTVLYLFGLLR